MQAPPAGSNDTTATAQIKVTAVAAQTIADVEATVSIPIPQQDTLAPKMVSHSMPLTGQGATYVGNVEVKVDTKLLGGVTIDVRGTNNGGKIEDAHNRVHWP